MKNTNAFALMYYDAFCQEHTVHSVHPTLGSAEKQQKIEEKADDDKEIRGIHYSIKTTKLVGF